MNENLSKEQFHFHMTSPIHRESIARTGLRVEYDEGEGLTDPGVYLSPRVSPHVTEHHDVWRVNTSGLPLHEDPYGDEGGGEVYTKKDIEPERLALHRAGTPRRDANGRLLGY